MLKTEKDKISYIFGQQVASDILNQGIEINTDIFVQSLQGFFNGEEPKLTVPEMEEVLRSVQQKLQAQQSASGDENIQKGKDFLAANKEQEGVITTDSGLQYKVKESGSGKTPSASDTVVTHYEGRTIDGKVFDSSYKRGQPASFPVNRVIAGWTEALQLMSEGDKWELFIPSDLAYGAQGAGADIGPHETLIFDIELISVQ